MRYLFLSSVFNIVFTYHKDMTIMLDSGKAYCFFENVLYNQVIDIEYQVIDATHGDLYIHFHLADPEGHEIVNDFKKSENAHRHTAVLTGIYRLCFDNGISSYSDKTVFFDILIENEEQENEYYVDDGKEMQLGNDAESYVMKVRDISDAIYRVKDYITTASRLQELHSAHEARDRNLAEEMSYRVSNWSISLICLMILVGITQVIFVKSLFKDQATTLRKQHPAVVRSRAPK